MIIPSRFSGKRFLSQITNENKDIFFQGRRSYRGLLYNSLTLTAGIVLGLSIGFKYHDFINQTINKIMTKMNKTIKDKEN